MCTIIAIITPSRGKKKYTVRVASDNRIKTLHFGAKGYEDYTTHKDKKRKARYLARNRKKEDWSDPFTAGFWSTHILWNKLTIDASIRDTAKRFSICIF